MLTYLNEIINNADIEQLLPEKRVALDNISWQNYEQILNALGENRAARVHYYQGILEIMTPLEAHESSSENIGILIHILTEELNLNIKSLASTTLKIPDKNTGAEPDKCYYKKKEPAVRGKTVNLNQDPPPDLVLEVDITNTDINKKQLYQDIQVPKFWRYNGKKLTSPRPLDTPLLNSPNSTILSTPRQSLEILVPRLNLGTPGKSQRLLLRMVLFGQLTRRREGGEVHLYSIKRENRYIISENS